MVLAALAATMACSGSERYEPRLGTPERLAAHAGDLAGFFPPPQDRDGLLIARSGRIVRSDGQVVSANWNGPVDIAVDLRNRVWAIDSGGGDERPRIAPGRERNRTSRNRHATFLPKGSRPVAVAADETEVYVCDAATMSVLRFHVGLDDVPRQRGPLKGVKCRYDIAVWEDGSIVTASDDAILRYPRR